jgi:protease I
MEKKSVLMVISQERFRDEELHHPESVFRQKGFDVTIAAPEKKEARGMLGATVNPDMTITDAAQRHFDAVVVVGGNGAPQYLWNNQALLNIVRTHHASGKPVGAICLAPVVLAQAGILKGVEATIYKSPESVAEFAKHGVKMVERDLVTSGTVVTANGPAAARKFGLALAELISN